MEAISRQFPSNDNIVPYPVTHDPLDQINQQADLEIEFEAVWGGAYMHEFNPMSGDLVFIHRRRVIDCAHCPFLAEIHPPDTIVVSRSFVSQPYSNLDPVRTTDVYVWFNAFAPAAVPIGTTVYASPRPDAKSHLLVTTQEAGYYTSSGVVVSLSLTTGGYSAQFSSIVSNQFTPIDSSRDYGQWHFPDAVAPTYIDNWQLSWVTP